MPTNLQPVVGENATTVWLFGKEYQKKIEYSATKRVGVFIQGTSVLINSVEPLQWLNRATTTHQLRRFLAKTAQAYIVPRTAALARTMNTTYGRLSLKEQRSRWGSCSSLGNLNFNWRLVHFPPAIIDYVIIHELAHRTHLNHSAEFWQLVATHDPEYTKHRGWLKRRQLVVE